MCSVSWHRYRPRSGNAHHPNIRDPMSHPQRIVSAKEELANALTHGVGLVASVVGLPILIIAAQNRGDFLTIIGTSVFGATLIALYAASTLYHATPHPVRKQRWRVADHMAIYLLIAGTYTPFTLGVLRGTWGWTLFGIVWTLAALGVLGTGTLWPDLIVAGVIAGLAISGGSSTMRHAYRELRSTTTSVVGVLEVGRHAS